MQIADSGVELKRGLLGQENVVINLSLHCVSSRCTALSICELYGVYSFSGFHCIAGVYPCIVLPGINLMHCEKLQPSVYFAHPPTFTLAIVFVLEL